VESTLNRLSVAGLTLGAVLGLFGTFVTQRSVQAVAWEIDGTALVVAGSLLALKFSRKGSDIVAGGFLVFAMGSAVMLVGAATSLVASAPSFGAGAALWTAGLLLIGSQRGFALGVRLIGLAAAVLFGITATLIFWGSDVLPTSSPLPFFAYPLLVATFACWIWSLLREPAPSK